MSWIRITFGDILKERKGLIDPNDSSLFQLNKIEKIDFSRGEIYCTEYTPTKTKQIIVYPDDFVFSGLNIEKGAVSINTSGEKLVVSANYSTCEVDYNKIDKAYFLSFMKSTAFKSLLKEKLKKYYGFTRPKHLSSLNFFIPETLQKQNDVIQELKNLEFLNFHLKSEIDSQLDLVKQLRQAFLREAMQGKLVSQDPNDESASVLLEKIKVEKERLIKEKKIKKQKPLPPITEDEIPFEIPENWVWCRLGEICEKIGSGSTPKGSNYADHGFPFFRSQNVHDNGLVYDDIKYVSDKVQKKMNGTVVMPKDILLNITGGSLGRCALVPKEFTEGNVSQHVCIVRPVLCDNSFLHKLILSPIIQQYIFSSTTGAGREGLPKYNLEQFVIPLPPLSEQQRIVAKLDELMHYCDKLEASIKESQKQNELLLQQVLREALEPKNLELV